MITGIIGLIIGLMIAIAGIYYLVKDKDDASSKKIYGTIAAIGAVVAVVSVIMLVL